MRTVTTFADVRKGDRGSVALVPTMGYFHEGHLDLISSAARSSDTVVVSLFVNPLQFNEDADLAAYPEDLARDAALAEEAGADLLFAPGIEEMYPQLPLTTVTVAGVGERMEGDHRTGHFDGVAIVVAKLLAGIQPDQAYFGRKDAQQLVLVTRLGADLSFPVEIIGRSTTREQDGLALSSRNTFLSEAERNAALSLSVGLAAAASAVEHGETEAAVLESIAGALVDGEPGAELEYVTLASQFDAAALPILEAPAFLAIAARVGATRLIDCVHIDRVGETWVPDLGFRLDHPSILYGEA
ncbi:MAG: pantoate--beta-alanine ligase [Acidimicrobiia bacterium]|nr:MAG: pantoate--beta-alanine ligase [Acidimicrobiia bacterium]